jgi:hypothetical protein
MQTVSAKKNPHQTAALVGARRRPKANRDA